MCLMTEVHLQFTCGLPVFVIEVSRGHVSSNPLLCFAGEPFYINGEAGPYDPKYHEQWLRNNAREHAMPGFVAQGTLREERSCRTSRAEMRPLGRD
jgi:hypothetical protein